MATLKEVAQAAGVSAATASRALRGVDRISEQTRIKVIDTAKRMNFSLSRSASQLASGRTMRVVTLFNGPLNTWFNASCLEGMVEVFSPAGYDLVPAIVVTQESIRRFFHDLPNERNVDGIILPSFRIDHAIARILQQVTIPIVGLDTAGHTGLDGSVTLDNATAMHDAVQLLHNLGHQRIGFIGHPQPGAFPSSAQIRANYFIESAQALGYPPEHIDLFPSAEDIIKLGYDDGIAEIAGRVMRSPIHPTALCTEMDEVAIPLIEKFRSIGIRVPEDISVIGFDNTDQAALVGLTTLHQAPLQMARMAAQKLLTLMNHETLDEPETLAPAKLILRNTTARYMPQSAS